MCYGKGKREFNIAHNHSFQLSYTRSATHTHTHRQHSPSPLPSSSLGFFFCIIDALCLSSRTHHLELLIVHPTKKKRELINRQKATLIVLSLARRACLSIHPHTRTHQPATPSVSTRAARRSIAPRVSINEADTLDEFRAQGCAH